VPTVAVLPVKSFRHGKGRMADDLSPDIRARLGQRLAERTAELAAEAGLVPVLVAGDDEVAQWAVELGFPSIPDPGSGLNAAAESGVRWAGLSSSSWLVLHTDLPLLTRGELEEVVDAMSGDGWVIAPSSDGGTSALGGIGESRFAYGPGSFHLHLARNPSSRIITRPGLLHDIDTFDDLESARRHRRGSWLAELS